MENRHVEEPYEAYERPLNFEKVWQMFQETDRLLTEKFRETDKKINDLTALFTSQWGKLVESLVEGDLISLLNRRGIRVESVIQRRKGSRDGRNFEFDLIAVNTNEIVIVEVKTTLRPDDIKDFIEKLNEARVFMPEYKQMKVYGGVAFIRADAGAERMAEHQGLFVIRSGKGSSE
ncbi:MAG: hypothetical protein ACLFPE_05530, partial [Bacteroidales bacterium]